MYITKNNGFTEPPWKRANVTRHTPAVPPEKRPAGEWRVPVPVRGTAPTRAEKQIINAFSFLIVIIWLTISY